MSHLAAKHIVLGLSGGIACYKAAELCRALVKAGVTPDQGPILVTGTPGGVGSVATALLAKAGFTVVASYGEECLSSPNWTRIWNSWIEFEYRQWAVYIVADGDRLVSAERNLKLGGLGI